jgi:antibiotic biosynthesis monooxygenase (ABM) superfamily enzyme
VSQEDSTDRVDASVPDHADGPVTTTVTRRAKPGHEPFYEEFLEGIIAAATRFPGHLGVEVFRPESASAGEYRVVYRFDSGEHLRAWLDSAEHAAWLERAEPHVIGPMRTQLVTGLETWFTLPGQPAKAPPPPYKMALLTWITIFPLITLVVIVLEPSSRGSAGFPGWRSPPRSLSRS